MFEGDSADGATSTPAYLIFTKPWFYQSSSVQELIFENNYCYPHSHSIWFLILGCPTFCTRYSVFLFLFILFVRCFLEKVTQRQRRITKLPLMPMGVLAPGSAHARPSAQPPIDMSGNFPAHVSAESPSKFSKKT